MSFDHWKTTNPQDEELGSCPQPGQDDEPDQTCWSLGSEPRKAVGPSLNDDDDESEAQAYQEQCWRDFPADFDPIPEGSLDNDNNRQP